jgi:PAS domain-containing protein
VARRFQQHTVDAVEGWSVNRLEQHPELYRMALDSLPEHVAILDRDGVIIGVNRAWRNFAKANGAEPFVGMGVSYLTLCESVVGEGADASSRIAEALRRVIAGRQRSFSIHYPCHSPTVQRYFQLQVSPLPLQDGRPIGAVISHTDITKQWFLEQEREQLVRRMNGTDGDADGESPFEE